VMPVLFNGPTGYDADLSYIDGIVDLRPGEFFVAIFGFSAARHVWHSGANVAIS